MTVVMDAHSKWNHSSIRDVERASIRAFVESCSEDLIGCVLDYGCGKQPYRDIVEGAGGDYWPYDRLRFPASVTEEDWGVGDPLTSKWDAILCNQVMQFIPDVLGLLERFRAALLPGGVLVMTYATNWDEVEPADLHRFTSSGMTSLLSDARFTVLRHERRAEVLLGGFRFPLGYGVLARA